MVGTRACTWIVGLVAVVVAGALSCSGKMSESIPEGGAGSGNAGAGGGTTTPGCQCPVGATTPRPLECLCGSGFCPQNFDESVSSYGDCGGLTVKEGCGLRIVASGPNYTGFSDLFDIESGELVGAMRFSDVAYGDCNFGYYLYGVVEEPCSFTQCSPCPISGGLPACE